MRIKLNEVKVKVREANKQELTDYFKKPLVLIYELSDLGNVNQRYMSLDQSIQLLYSKISLFTEMHIANDW